MADPILGAGTSISYSAVTPTTYTLLAQLYDCNIPEQVVADVKASHYGTTGQVHNYIPGWTEPGVVDCEMEYVAANHAALVALLKVKHSFKITLSDGSNFVFVGYVNKIGGAIPMEDRVTVKFSIKVTNLLTHATT